MRIKKIAGIIRWILLVPLSWVAFLGGTSSLLLLSTFFISEFSFFLKVLLGVLFLIFTFIVTRAIVVMSMEFAPKRKESLNILLIFYTLYFAYLFVVKDYSTTNIFSLLYMLFIYLSMIINILSKF